MTHLQKLLITATRVNDYMGDYYECDCPVHYENDGDSEPAVRKCPHWLKFVDTCIAFMKLDPPFRNMNSCNPRNQSPILMIATSLTRPSMNSGLRLITIST